MAVMIENTDTTISARDGYRLAATVFAAANPQAVVLINLAAAVPRKIYRGFAEYLAQRAFAVLKACAAISRSCRRVSRPRWETH